MKPLALIIITALTAISSGTSAQMGDGVYTVRSVTTVRAPAPTAPVLSTNR